MKWYQALLAVSAIAITAGCDNSVEENVGGLPNIQLSGSVLAGNVRYAKVQLVGIDQYGQPQITSDGGYVGQVYRVNNDNGQYSAYFNGAYTGALMAVASYDDYEYTITPATATTAAVTEQRQTQLRCVLPDGCRTEAGATASYGEWYDAPADFEMWSLVHNAQSVSQLNISPLTHLSAKLAFADYITNGTNCTFGTDGTDGSCMGEILTNAIVTPESAYEANSRVQKQFLLSDGVAPNIAPWVQGTESSSDSVAQVDEAKHGLISMALMLRSLQSDVGLMTELAEWTSTYLDHQGQWYGNDQTNAPAEVDFEDVYSLAVQVEAQYTAAQGNLSDSALSSAAAAYNAEISSLANQVSTITGDALPIVEGADTLQERVAASKAFIADVRSWVTELEQQNYAPFFDDEIDAEIKAMELQWDAFNQTLAPVLSEFFLPMAQLTEYALSCIRTTSGNCDAGHVLHSLNGTAITFDPTQQSIRYELNQDNDSFPKIFMVGGFDDVYEQSAQKKYFSFTQDVVVETAAGAVRLDVTSGAVPLLEITLGSELSQDTAPDLKAIDVTLPGVLVRAKDVLAATTTYLPVYFSSEDFVFSLYGTKDATRPSEPVHFNIASVDIQGEILNGTSELADSVGVGITINSENYASHYGNERFPSLDVSLDKVAFHSMTQFEGVDVSTSTLGGWLVRNADVIDNEVIPLGISYSEESQYTNLDASLRTILDLDSPVDFGYGELSYAGGKTALVVWRNSVSETEMSTRQCLEVSGTWACFTAVSMSELGCGNSYGAKTGSINDAFNYLKSENCIAQVKIDGRGVYDIQYSDGVDLSSGDQFDIQLNQASVLGISSMSLRTIGKFNDADGNQLERALISVLGSATDEDNITLGMSVTHGYYGFGGISGLSFLDVIPQGDRSLWLAVGHSENDADATVYYVSQGIVTLTLSAFDYSEDEANDKFHDQPLGYVRYDDQLLGTLRKEGDLYVIRYIDGSWQVIL